MNDFKFFYDCCEKLLNISAECLSLCEQDNVDQLLIQLDNRSRLINVFTQIYNRLDADQCLNMETKSDINKLINKVHEVDEKVMSYLNTQKEKTQEEISSNFANKKGIKGYNLNNLR